MDLTQTQLSELKQDLITLLAELAELLEDRSGLANTVELDQTAVGRLSRVDALQAQQMAAAQKRRTQIRHQQVLAALERHSDDDEFGICASCGDYIGYRRLKARPEAFLCIRCSK